MTLHYIFNERRCAREEWYELHGETEGKTRKERNRKRRREDWGVVAFYGAH